MTSGQQLYISEPLFYFSPPLPVSLYGLIVTLVKSLKLSFCISLHQNLSDDVKHPCCWPHSWKTCVHSPQCTRVTWAHPPVSCWRPGHSAPSSQAPSGLSCQLFLLFILENKDKPVKYLWDSPRHFWGWFDRRALPSHCSVAGALYVCVGPSGHK